MTTPTVAVDTADLRRAAGRVGEAADAVTKRLAEMGPSLSPGRVDGWATVAAMGTCAGAITDQLHGLTGALTAEAEELRAAAARYDEADRRAVHRYRYE